ANKELVFQNEKKTKRADELIIANKELAYQKDEKGKRAEELLIANKELLIQNKEKEKRHDELVIITADAERSKHELQVQQIELEMQNEELKNIEILLRNSNDLNETLFKTIPFGMDIVDENGTVLFQSDNFKKIFGESAIGKKCWDLYKDDKKQCKDCPLTKSITIGETDTYESQGVLGNRIFEISHTGMIYQGKKAILEIFKDITERKRIELELIETRKQIEEKAAAINLIVQSTSDWIWEINEEGIYCYCSDKVEQILGYTADEIIGKSPFDFMTEEEIKRVGTIFQNSLQACEPIFDIENWNIHKDGHLVCLLTNGIPKFDKTGKLTGYIGADKDITKRKQDEKERVLQLAQISSLLDSIPDMIFFKDIEGVYLGSNPHFSDFAGKSQSEIVGKTDYDLFEKAIADSFRQYDREMLMQKLPRHNEEWVTYADGKKVLLDTLKTPYWAGDGSLIGILGISRDITERNSTQEDLKMMSTRLTLATRSGGVGVWDYDILNDLLMWDDQLFALYGIQKADFKGAFQAWQTIFHPEDAERVDAEIQMAIRGEKDFDTEFSVVWPDRSIHTIRALATVQHDNSGNSVRMIGTNWDITVQKQFEQEIKLQNAKLLKLNTERDKFFSIISHDLRGPLGGFMGLTEMLAAGNEYYADDEKDEIMLDLSHSARNIFNLLENLLEWSKMNKGLSEFKAEKLDLNALVMDCKNILAESAKKKMIVIDLSICNEAEVLGDKNMLESVLRNLVSNAIKFTPQGGEICISAKISENKMMLVSVKDTGIGMREKLLNELFHINVSSRRPGTEGERSGGLGLLLCKEFVEKQGGKIWVESEQNKGSVFSFSIPCTGQNAKEITVPTTELAAKPESPENKLKILIAEDDVVSARFASALVKNISKEVINVSTGADAVEACREHPDIDLVLMDIAMPIMDGYEACQLIRQFNKEVCIIAQTSFALNSQREKAIAAGCMDYIAKPINKDEFRALIQKYFGKLK
ncbi:MAG: PAS domain S-box protein, partial [Bacteroidales bacterium]